MGSKAENEEKRKKKKNAAEILGQKLFRTREIPRSGSKAEDGEKEKERAKGKPPGPKHLASVRAI